MVIQLSKWLSYMSIGIHNCLLKMKTISYLNYCSKNVNYFNPTISKAMSYPNLRI